MFFLRRNGAFIMIIILAFGILGTLISYLTVPEKYNYEEYYILNESVSTDVYSQIVVQVNEDINMSENRKAMEMEYIPASNAILLSVSEATAAMLDELTMEFGSVLDSEGISYSSDNGIFVETVDNDAEKWTPIIISLLSGAVLGLVTSLVNNRVTSDEDVKYYLNQKTLGTF